MTKVYYSLLLCFFLLFTSCLAEQSGRDGGKTPLDYVDPYIGNISHLLMPTYPTIHLPNSMLRVYPERYDYTSNKLNGLPIVVTSHRGSSAFALSPITKEDGVLKAVIPYSYDREVVQPHYYSVFLDEYETHVEYAPSHQSAIYNIRFKEEKTPYLILNSKDGELNVEGNSVYGYQQIEKYPTIKDHPTRIYLYLKTDVDPSNGGVMLSGAVDVSRNKMTGENSCVVLQFPQNTSNVTVRYGISFISVEQAKKNMEREIKDHDLNAVKENGYNIWNEKLGKIIVEGDCERAKTVFYTSLYRTYERMVCLSEDGRYFSAFDGQVHDDEGIPFYTDDWIWDTYRATHPLRVIIEPEMEVQMINSFVRMAEQMPNFWMPTFPGATGDSRRMNANHGVATVLDAHVKGLSGFDLEKAYLASKKGITEKTLAPWSSMKAGSLDKFYKEKGYFPALKPDEKEIAIEVHPFEKRQPVSVTLGTVYDEWCLARMAKLLGKSDDYSYFLSRSLNYHKLFNPQTKFFHPKDSDGNFISHFDYRFSGGRGGRNAYCENNAWIYRWDIPHNIADLVEMQGGEEAFVSALETMYDTPLGKSKDEFYAIYPDHTGNVGQYSMGNEPCLHIPYLYNYAGQPWRTQKRIRSLLDQWFRADVMGVPGDEDGGGMTAFVVFSQLGFYPVTPGLPMYVIGSPTFERAVMQIGNGKRFEVVCDNYGIDNKYIQSAKLNGQLWDKSWFSHDDLMQGGKLELTMGPYANKSWATTPDSYPPSFEMMTTNGQK